MITYSVHSLVIWFVLETKNSASQSQSAASEQAIQNRSSLPNGNNPPVLGPAAETPSIAIPVNEDAANLGSGGCISRQHSKDSQKSGNSLSLSSF